MWAGGAGSILFVVSTISFVALRLSAVLSVYVNFTLRCFRKSLFSCVVPTFHIGYPVALQTPDSLQAGASSILECSNKAMSQVIRGVERSKRFLQASRQSFATSAPTSVVVTQNLTPLATSWRHLKSSDRRSQSIVSAPITPGYGCVRLLSPDDVLSLDRSFATVEGTTTPERSPSALEQANLEEVTPGHAIYILQRHAALANGKKLIRQSDFVRLCESSRPGKMKDAKVIATALKEFKRCNRFVLQTVGSRAAVEGMLRSMTPTWKFQDGKPRVRAALFVAGQIVDETTGLYFAVETLTVDKVLEELYNGLIKMQDNNMKVIIDKVDDEAEEGEETSSDFKLAKDALRLTEGMIKLLIKRKSRPEWDMNKRSKSQYLKRLQIGSGPYRSTLQLATKISLLVGGTTVAQEKVIKPIEEAWWTDFVDEAALKLIEDAKELENQTSALAAVALGDAAEDEFGAIDDERSESNADEGDAVVEAGEEKTH